MIFNKKKIKKKRRKNKGNVFEIARQSKWKYSEWKGTGRVLETKP